MRLIMINVSAGYQQIEANVDQLCDSSTMSCSIIIRMIIGLCMITTMNRKLPWSALHVVLTPFGCGSTSAGCSTCC